MENLKVSLKLVLRSKDSEVLGNLGPGIVTLLKGVKASGSLNQATKQMDMSYSKAWRIIREAEEMLGFKLIDRFSGSKGSALTKEGLKLLDIYDATKQAAYAAAEETFQNQVKKAMNSK